MIHAPAASLRVGASSQDDSMLATQWADRDLFRMEALPGAELPPLTEADIGNFESAPADWV